MKTTYELDSIQSYGFLLFCNCEVWIAPKSSQPNHAQETWKGKKEKNANRFWYNQIKYFQPIEVNVAHSDKSGVKWKHNF